MIGRLVGEKARDGHEGGSNAGQAQLKRSELLSAAREDCVDPGC